jgi:CYTH domain-containing protein
LAMDKTYQTEIYRSFLIHGLPEPLTRASSHLQLFDNYVENTRLRIRTIRVPEEKKWTWILQQRFPLHPDDFAVWKHSEIFLNETEHRVFGQFEGREIRKNRYYHEFDGKELEFDIYLGALWGLNLLNVYFENVTEMKDFEFPSFVIYEVTNSKFFTGEVLVGKTFLDVQDEFEKMRQTKTETV